MLTRRVIPCLDTRDGRVVKGVRFRDVRDAGDPIASAERYARHGADELVMLDISATAEGRSAARELVAALREVLAIPLTVGGGIRQLDDAIALLEAGADKVSVNSAALSDPDLLTALAARCGCQCVTVAIDAARDGDTWRAWQRGGTTPTGRDAVAWAAEAVDRGAGEVLLTSIDRDGTRSGYDLELVAAVSGTVRVPVIASGGAATVDHLAAALAAGADAVLAASIFHHDGASVASIKRDLAARGVEVRQ